MSRPASDAYAVLGVRPDVSDGELRRVYRGLVQRHHPDHNGGSPESAARFAQIQEAYSVVTRARQGSGGAQSATRTGQQATPTSPRPPRTGPQAPRTGPSPPRAAAADPGIEKRIADLERELAAARAAGRSAGPARPAREPAASTGSGQPPRPTPEELGHYETDDSFTSIIDDVAAGLGERLKDARRSDLSRRLTDLFGGGSDDE
jgi:hypothetical protein